MIPRAAARTHKTTVMMDTEVPKVQFFSKMAGRKMVWFYLAEFRRFLLAQVFCVPAARVEIAALAAG
jgi:hypothetical protein